MSPSFRKLVLTSSAFQRSKVRSITPDVWPDDMLPVVGMVQKETWECILRPAGKALRLKDKDSLDEGHIKMEPGVVDRRMEGTRYRPSVIQMLVPVLYGENKRGGPCSANNSGPRALHTPFRLRRCLASVTTRLFIDSPLASASSFLPAIFSCLALRLERLYEYCVYCSSYILCTTSL
jgi:hypothetical protein